MFLTLSELCLTLKSFIAQAFPEYFWVVAEIAGARCNQKGHCYLELVEKDGSSTLAQIKATIWAFEYRRLSQKFQASTGETLRPGLKIMFLAAVSYHEVYGLSLSVRDIDPAYTLGELALRKKETIERLKREGLFDMNRSVSLPLVPQRIAVISSPTAAGFGDFRNHLETNPYGYRIFITLFPSIMQGNEAEASILEAFSRIIQDKDVFDAVAVIRGGGAAMDLACFDSYEIAKAAALCPIPVITGIGHERDDTIVDLVAHTRVKTPTAAAEFFLSGIRSFDEHLMSVQRMLASRVIRIADTEKFLLEGFIRRLSIVLKTVLAENRKQLDLMTKELKTDTGRLLQRAEKKLDAAGQAIRLLDPSRILRRGYSITRSGGRIVTDPSVLADGDRVETQTAEGVFISRVEK